MKGLECVYYDTSKPSDRFTHPMSLSYDSNGLTASIPLRYAIMHACLRPATLRLHSGFLGVVLSACPQYSRVRTRIYHGSNMELQYHLSKP